MLEGGMQCWMVYPLWMLLRIQMQHWQVVHRKPHPLRIFQWSVQL
ncbi:Protein of unknown function [Pyronema omphalodes CBS 100304]|uniref:Uncharacterized protein n=1 Tax=Pyronema omphalodes (strain CBS 100304) TaxID=1076935 RepID=U4KYX9_PYROM|nr:Protein of unknown function [Pyronema omphalodes CBS 100304]